MCALKLHYDFLRCAFIESELITRNKHGLVFLEKVLDVRIETEPNRINRQCYFAKFSHGYFLQQDYCSRSNLTAFSCSGFFRKRDLLGICFRERNSLEIPRRPELLVEIMEIAHDIKTQLYNAKLGQ